MEFTSLMEGMTYFAARRDKKLVGILGCSAIDGSVRIAHVAVEPESRHQGIAKALMEVGLEWAKRANATSIWIETLTRFQPAIALFRKSGFKETGVFHKHLWKEDVMLMEIVF